MSYKISLILLLSMLGYGLSGQSKLVFVQELFRHGVRYPIYPTSVDNSSYATKENKVGELSTEGKNMHYLLGQQVYKLYWEQLFPGEKVYNNTKFFIKSTDVNRTIESCQSHMMGIFENLDKLELTAQQVNNSIPPWPNTTASSGSVFPKAQPFQPIPIHIQKLGSQFNWRGDFLRAYSPTNCPNQDLWNLQNHGSQFAQKVYNDPKFVQAIKAVSKELNKTIDFSGLGLYYDNYVCGKSLNRYVPPIFDDPQYHRTLSYINTIDMYINLFLTDLQLKTTSSGFFEQTINSMKRALNKSSPVQWVIYSAHDTTVANMLAAMDLTNAACIYDAFVNNQSNGQTCIYQYPQFASNLIFEVYQNRSLKVRYNGQYRNISFCSGYSECTVQQMQKWYNDKIKTDNYFDNCGLHNDDKLFYLGASIIEFGIILIFVIYFIVKQLKNRQSGDKGKGKIQNNKNKKSIQMKTEIIQPLVQSAEKVQIEA